MFQMLSKSRAGTYLRGMLGEREFRARSAERDAETDRGRVDAILTALDAALRGAETEQAGLTRHVDDVLGRAAITVGNGNDEYQTRENSKATISICSRRKSPTASAGCAN